MKTYWQCDYCDATGHVEHGQTSGFWSVMQALLGEHKRVSPKCYAGSRESIRVCIEPRTTPPEGRSET